MSEANFAERLRAIKYGGRCCRCERDITSDDEIMLIGTANGAELVYCLTCEMFGREAANALSAGVPLHGTILDRGISTDQSVRWRKRLAEMAS